jgi:hypothetical protein
MSKEKDEFEHILDATSVEFMTLEELEEAADEATARIYEVCSGQEVLIADYKATREKCIRGIMETLGKTPMFNDIMDVVAVFQMIRTVSGKKIHALDEQYIELGGVRVSGYFMPVSQENLDRIVTRVMD